MAQAILDQLGACRSLMQALQGRPGFAAASSAEGSHFVATLRTVALTTQEMGGIATAIQAAGFAPADENAALDALADASRNSPQPVTKPKRTLGQDYQELTHYLTAEIVDKLRNNSVTELMDHLIKLGLRNPSETTSQVISLLVMHQQDGLQKVLDMTMECKLQMNHALKNVFKTRVKHALPPASYVDILDTDPQAFRLKHPALYGSAFPNSGPVRDPVGQVQMSQLKLCRMRRLRGSEPLQLALGSSSQPLPPSVMQFGQALVGQMQTLAHQVSQLQNLQGASQPPSSSRRALPSLLPPRQAEPALPALLPPRQALPAPPPSVEGAGSSDAALGASSVEGTGDSHAAPAAVSVEGTGGVSAAAPGVVGIGGVAAAAPGGVSAAAPGAATGTTATVSVDDMAKHIQAELEKNKGKSSKPKAKAKGKAKAKAKANAKAKATDKKAGGDSGGSLTTKAPSMPAFAKRAPMYWGTCTIYSDGTKRKWRCIEADNPRRDVKFSWSKDGWSGVVAWCLENGRDE